MAKFQFDLNDFFRGLDWTDQRVRRGAERGMHDAVDNLVRVSSEITPFDKGTLSKSWSRNVEWKGDTIVGEVTYSVTEESGDGQRFNYALWTHEEKYEYGEGTKARPGTQGASGKFYEPGRKYLERPLKGESEWAKQHIADEIRKELG